MTRRSIFLSMYVAVFAISTANAVTPQAHETPVAATPGMSAPPASVPCATQLDASDVKSIMASKDATDVKTKELWLLLKGSVSGGWGSRKNRQNDLSGILTDAVSGVLSKEADSAKVSTDLTAALNAACEKLDANSDVSAAHDAAMTAAGLPLSTTAPKGDTTAPTIPDLSGSGVPDPVVGDTIGLEVRIPGFQRVDQKGIPYGDYYYAPSCAAFKVDNKDSHANKYYVHFVEFNPSFAGRGTCQTGSLGNFFASIFTDSSNSLSCWKNLPSNDGNAPSGPNSNPASDPLKSVSLLKDASNISSGNTNDDDNEQSVQCGPSDTTQQLKDLRKVEYAIDVANLRARGKQTYGFDYGVLTVPFKFHLSDRATTGSASVGGFVGPRLTNDTLRLSYIVAAGFGNVSATTTTGSGTTAQSSSTTNKPSFSTATGFIITFTQSTSFQAGILVGVDWAGHGQYQYNGKPWLGISFGSNLTK